MSVKMKRGKECNTFYNNKTLTLLSIVEFVFVGEAM